MTPWGKGPFQMGSALRSSRSYTGSFTSSVASSSKCSHGGAQENVQHAVHGSQDFANRSRDAMDIGCLVDNTPFVKVA